MIETEQQATILRDIGAEFGQGYHFGRPEPIDELEATLLVSVSVVDLRLGDLRVGGLRFGGRALPG